MDKGYAASSDGCQIYYEVGGSGEPLILIEGLGYAHWMWIKQLPLSERLKLIIFDNRGAGLSCKPKGPYTMDMFAEDLMSLMEHLKVEKAFVWGVSMGGMIAMHFAHRHQDRVSGLVLGETNFGVSSLPPSREALEVLMKPPSQITDRAQLLFERMSVAFSKRFVAEHKNAIDEIVRLRMGFEESPEAYNSQLAAVLGFDFRERLKDIKAPTLIVTGDEDYVVNPQNSYIMNQLIPKSRLVVLKGAGHLAVIERADDYNRLVLNFIDDVKDGTFRPSREPLVI